MNNNTPAFDPDDELELYKQVNAEMQRFYDFVAKSFEHVKNKALALLVGEVAIVTFLFQGFSFDLKDKPPIYGVVVLGVGIALLAFAYIMYLTVIATAEWHFPTEEHDMKNPTARFNGNPLEYQKYLHAEYMSKVIHCIKQSGRRATRFMYGTYALSIGVFLIILVKYGGGA